MPCGPVSPSLVFKPYRYRERLLVDGAVINRLPVHVAREMGADKVLAVDVKRKR